MIYGRPGPDKPKPNTSGFTARLEAAAWITAGLLTLGLCLMLALIALLPGRRAPVAIPVTGEMPPTPPPQAFPPLAGEQEPTPGTPTLAPGLWYRAEMERRLSNCYDSFHAFYLLEQVAFHEPALLASEEWRASAAVTVEEFRATCEQLGNLPKPPHSYQEIDGWLKLAAAEVGPAVDSFSSVVDDDDYAALFNTINHLSNFMEYTRQAEAGLAALAERKEF